MIQYNGNDVGASMTNYQPTDFSPVTAHPEFVLKGKKFFDETGTLREGNLERIQASEAPTLNDDGVLIFAEVPAVNADGVLIN